MRYPIWKKDDFFEFLDGRRIDMESTAVALPDASPLTWQFDWARKPCGIVTDIREDDGEISGEVLFWDEDFNDSNMEEMGLRLGGYFTEVKKNEDGTVVLSCNLRGVSILSNWHSAAIPRTRPDYEEIDPPG